MAGKTFPAFPAHAQNTILRICQEPHGLLSYCPLSKLSHCNRLNIKFHPRVPDLWVSFSSEYEFQLHDKSEMILKYNSPRNGHRWHTIFYNWSVDTNKAISMINSTFSTCWLYQFQSLCWGNHGRRLRRWFYVRCLPSTGTCNGGKVVCDLKFTKSYQRKISWAPLKLTSSECQKTTLIRSQHWLR